MKIKILFSFLVFIFYVYTGSLYSQNMPKGTLLGRVISDEGMKALPYSTVRVTGTNNGAASDLNGNYIIRNINAGKQTISVSFIGYQTKNIDVVIKPDALNRLDVALKMSNVNGEEVVVTAQRIGQQNAINDQINSDAIKNVVSADRLQENPDANIAEALGRLPGLSLIRSGGEGVAIIVTI